MTIKEVSKKYGISTDTLRYYERIGLFPRVKRTSSGIRDFDEEACDWVEFIKCMRDCGVQIAPLTEYVALYFEDDTERERLDILKEQRARLLRQRDDLDGTIKRLDAKITYYEGVVDKKKRALGSPAMEESKLSFYLL